MAYGLLGFFMPEWHQFASNVQNIYILVVELTCNYGTVPVGPYVIFKFYSMFFVA